MQGGTHSVGSETLVHWRRDVEVGLVDVVAVLWLGRDFGTGGEGRGVKLVECWVGIRR